ncbi:hypothetical protein AB0P45_30105 [Streptomyces niveus]|uniref:hypothetical protein n=1 Tax=Streptomyces niveus TaxID=193462 RepID=UPI00341FA682
MLRTSTLAATRGERNHPGPAERKGHTTQHELIATFEQRAATVAEAATAPATDDFHRRWQLLYREEIARVATMRRHQPINQSELEAAIRFVDWTVRPLLRTA